MGHERGLAGVMVTLGDVARGLGRNEEAKAAYEKASDLFWSAPDVHEEARAYLGLSVVELTISGDATKARKFLDDADLRCQQSGSWECRGNVLLAEANLHRVLGDKDKALEELGSAQEIFYQMRRYRTFAGIHWAEAQLLQDKDEARSSLEAAVRFFGMAGRFDLERRVLDE